MPHAALHPGMATLRRAIRLNAVSFPSQIPIFLKSVDSEMQWRAVLLYFVCGWNSAALAKRFHVPIHRIWQILNQWAVRAMSVGYIQVIDAEAFIACCRASRPDSAVVTSPGAANQDVSQIPDASREPGEEPGVSLEVSPARRRLSVLAALDSALDEFEQLDRDEFWNGVAGTLRTVRTSVLSGSALTHTSGI